MKGFLSGIFKWLKNRKSKIMIKEVKKSIEDTYTSFQEYLKDVNNDYEFIKRDFNELKFSIGSNFFLLRYDIQIKNQISLIRTYEIIPDLKSHGSKVEVLIPDLDILVQTDGIYFRNERTYTNSMTMELKEPQIINFGNQYTRQLIKFIMSR